MREYSPQSGEIYPLKVLASLIAANCGEFGAWHNTVQTGAGDGECNIHLVVRSANTQAVQNINWLKDRVVGEPVHSSPSKMIMQRIYQSIYMIIIICNRKVFRKIQYS